MEWIIQTTISMNHTISIVLEYNVCLGGQRGLLATCVLHCSSGMPAFLQVEQLGVRLLMGFFFTGAVNIIDTSALVLATLSSEANTFLPLLTMWDLLVNSSFFVWPLLRDFSKVFSLTQGLAPKFRVLSLLYVNSFQTWQSWDVYLTWWQHLSAL